MVGRAVGGFEGAAAAPSDRNPVGLVLAKACVQTSAVRSRAGAIGCPLLDEHQAQSGTHRGERECAGGSARAPWGMRGEIRPVAGRRGWCRSWSASRSTAAAWARTGWDCKKNNLRRRSTKNSCGWAFGSLASNRGRAGSAGTAAGVGCEAEGVGAGVSRAAGLTVLRQGPARRHQSAPSRASLPAWSSARPLAGRDEKPRRPPAGVPPASSTAARKGGSAMKASPFESLPGKRARPGLAGLVGQRWIVFSQ